MTPTAFLFPGQGSQGVGMGSALAAEFPVARATFAEADDILGFSLSALCFDGPADELTQTVNAQPAILVTSIAALRVLLQESPLQGACCMAGHSLGEYSALVAAGSLSFADGVRLTRVRGQLMARAGLANPGSMAAILKLEDKQVAAICAEAANLTGEPVQVANYNAPGQVVISGSANAVAEAGKLAAAAGGRPRALAVSIAAHSALMAPVVEEFAAHVRVTPFQPPVTPVFANLLSRPMLTPKDIRAELIGQLTGSVRWTESVLAMQAAGAGRFAEVGPGEVLAGLVKRIAPEAEIVNFRSPADLAAF